MAASVANAASGIGGDAINTVIASSTAATSTTGAASHQVSRAFYNIGISFFGSVASYAVSAVILLLILLWNGDGMLSRLFAQGLKPFTSGKTWVGGAYRLSRRTGPLWPILAIILVPLAVLLYLGLRLLAWIIYYNREILVCIAILVILVFLEIYGGQGVAIWNQTASLGATAWQAGATTYNTISGVAAVFQPSAEAVTITQFEWFFGVTDAMSNTQPIGSGRRADSIDFGALERALGPILFAAAVLTITINRARISIFRIVYLFFGAVIVYFIVLIVAITIKGTCCVAGGLCCLREVAGEIVNDFTGGLLVDLIGSNPIVCSLAELNGHFTCASSQNPVGPHCKGAIFDPETTGIYINGCPPNNRRLLCDGECETIDGVRRCNGCVHTRRALTVAGHLDNVEDFGEPCYEVCLNTTSLFKVCHAMPTIYNLQGNFTWTHIGACGGEPEPNARRQLQAYFGAAPELTSYEPTERRTDAVVDRATFARNLAARVGTRFTVEGLQCDLTHAAGTPFETFTDMMCIWRGYGRDAPKRGGRKLGAWFDTAHLLRTRAAKLDAMRDDPARWEKFFESSPQTDLIPAWEQLRRAVAPLLAAPPELPAILKRRRRTDDSGGAGQVCPQGQVYCCATGCREGPCPPDDAAATWLDKASCWLKQQINTMEGWDSDATYVNTQSCFANYQTQPETFPFGEHASSSSSLVYCYPRYPFDYRLPTVSASALQWTPCADPQCQCPGFYSGNNNHVWFAYIDLTIPEMILNWMRTTQLWISAVIWASGFLRYVIAYPWYGFWSAWYIPFANIFVWPIWWRRLFLPLEDVPGWNWGDQFYCGFVTHLGSFVATWLMIFLLIVIFRAWWPVLGEFVEWLFGDNYSKRDLGRFFLDEKEMIRLLMARVRQLEDKQKLL